MWFVFNEEMNEPFIMIIGAIAIVFVFLLLINSNVTAIIRLLNSKEKEVSSKIEHATKDRVIPEDGPFEKDVNFYCHPNVVGYEEKSKYLHHKGKKIKGSYKNGQLHGTFMEFNDENYLIAIGQYYEGKRSGLWEFYDNYGYPRAVGSFKENLQDGKWKIYNPEYRFDETIDPQFVLEETYVEGRLIDGNWEYYYYNGFIRVRGTYRHGLRHGEWKCYSEDVEGKEIGATVFRHDKACDYLKLYKENGEYLCNYDFDRRTITWFHEKGPEVRQYDRIRDEKFNEQLTFDVERSFSLYDFDYSNYLLSD
jgi:antitoxin component YwqK of YwqJK toxin-antitoxin module